MATKGGKIQMMGRSTAPGPEKNPPHRTLLLVKSGEIPLETMKSRISSEQFYVYIDHHRYVCVRLSSQVVQGSKSAREPSGQ